MTSQEIQIEEAAKRHETFLFAQEHSAQRLPTTEIYLIDCPKCSKQKLYFGSESFICKNCNVKGSFDELKELLREPTQEENELFEKLIVELKAERHSSGQGYFTLCPYHDDHNPSLYFNEKGFRCMACGKKGTLSEFASRVGILVAAAETR